jgi:hypothetical protein
LFRGNVHRVTPAPALQPYPVIATRIDPRSDEYRSNEASNRVSVQELSAALQEATRGGGDKYTSRHKAAGKLLPRERIELVLDRDSCFLELCPLAGKDVPGHMPGASIVGGIGQVSGVEVLITASESTVKGGAISEMSAWKSGRLSDIAEHNHLPSISMIESAGADLPNQAKIFVPGGRGFRDLTRRSQSQIPTICLVFGSSTAGGAYIPGMSDYVVMVQNQAQVYLAGPPLVKMATGEDTDHEELGGAEMHARISGVSDYLARDERDAIRIGREIVAHLDWQKQLPTPRPIDPPRTRRAPGHRVARHQVPFDRRGHRASSMARGFPVQAALYGTRWSAAGRTTAFRSASRTTGSLFSESRRRARSSSSCATRATCRWCSCRTSPASWSARSTSKRASSSTAPSSSTRCRTPPSRPSRS